MDEDDECFGFMGLTESPKRGNHKNIPLNDNLKKSDKRTAYIRKEIRYDCKSKFEEILNDYSLSERDLFKIMKLLEKYKKKK